MSSPADLRSSVDASASSFALSPSPPLLLSPSGFYFALALITAAVLASILNILATVPTFARKFQSKIEDFGNSQNGAFKTSEPCNISAQQLRLGQLSPRGTRLVFDPGGQSSSSSVQVPTTRHPKTFVSANRRHAAISSPSPCSTPASLIPIPTLDDLIVFDPGGVGIVLELAHEDLATFDEDARRLCLHARGHLSYYSSSSHFLHFRR
ncbi:hypothetical protein EDB84DRAFT_1562864 [Lactarius hengduanensis]|nr:hypothetical protein EDB84DRAFT_1562864 [Lactarius hengduanensis]